MSQTWTPSLSVVLFEEGDGAAGGLAPAVARRLAEAISMGLVADGEQLPAEAELAAQLSISTVSLRAALAILRQEGLLETRRGRNGGSFIRAPHDYSFDTSLERLAAMSPSRLRDLGYEVMAITGVVVSLAARRFDDDNIARLDDLASLLAEAGTPGECLKLDSRFRVELAVASQSERLTRRMVSLQAEYSDLLWIPAVGIDSMTCAERHAELAKAVRSGDPDLARSLAEEQVNDNTRRIVEHRLGMEA